MASTDRDALVALFHSIGGIEWKFNKYWTTGAEHCQMHGVLANDQDRVVGLDLSTNNLQGM